MQEACPFCERRHISAKKAENCYRMIKRSLAYSIKHKFATAKGWQERLDQQAAYIKRQFEGGE